MSMPETRLDGHDLAGHCRRRAATARWIAVLPLAAVEQHGPHLPLGVDTFIAEAYLARVRQILPAELAGDVSAGAAHRRFRRASGLSRHADPVRRHRDRGLDRAWRKPGARRPAQARPRHQPRRQCRGDGTGGARSARAARHARRHRRLAPLRLSGRSCSPARRKGTAFTAATSRPRSCSRRIRTKCAWTSAANATPATLAMAREFKWLGAYRPAGFAWMTQDLHPTGAVGDATLATAAKGEAALAHGATGIRGIAARNRPLRSRAAA